MGQSGFTLSQLSSVLKAHCYWYVILDLVTGGRCPNCFVSDSGPGIYQAFNEHQLVVGRMLFETPGNILEKRSKQRNPGHHGCLEHLDLAHTQAVLVG